MIKLSVIVPLYNVEQYLRKCVDSLLAQNYEDYELILVDDGSTDKSGAICDEYVIKCQMSNDKCQITNGKHQIRVIHQPNGGLSAARNSGLKVAQGDYVCFVDSDDYWEENVLGGLMEHIEREQLDVLRYDYQNVRVADAKHLEYEVFEPNKTPHIVDRLMDVVDGETYLNERMGYGCYAWQFILRRDLLVNSLTLSFINSFTEGIHFEDVDWLPRMMLKAKRVNSTTRVVYNYLHRQGSITKTQGNIEKIRKNVEDEMYIINKYKKLIDLHPNCQWLRKMQSSMAVGVLTTVACNFYQDRHGYIQRLKAVNAIPLSIADQGKTYARRAMLFNLLGSNMYCTLMHCLK